MGSSKRVVNACLASNALVRDDERLPALQLVDGCGDRVGLDAHERRVHLVEAGVAKFVGDKLVEVSHVLRYGVHRAVHGADERLGSHNTDIFLLRARTVRDLELVRLVRQRARCFGQGSI